MDRLIDRQTNCGNAAGETTEMHQNVIGHYQMYRAGSPICRFIDTMAPESIPVKALDQLNVAFVGFNPDDSEIADTRTLRAFYDRISELRRRNQNLKIWIKSAIVMLLGLILHQLPSRHLLIKLG